MTLKKFLLKHETHFLSEVIVRVVLLMHHVNKFVVYFQVSAMIFKCAAHPAFILGSVLLCPVVGRSRPAVVACCTVRSGVFQHWIHHLWPQGAVPPGFNPLRRGWVYRPAPEAPRKGECRRGPRHFWNCLSRWATALRQDPP